MKNSLTNIYENMYSVKIVEPIIESNETFSKFDLQDYTEIIYEAHSGHGDEKKIKNLIKYAVNNNLIKPFPKETKKGWMLQSIVDNSQYLTHKGETGFHDLRRYIEKLEKI